MRKVQILLVAVVLACSFIMMTRKDAAAVDVSIGGTVWMAKWDPIFYQNTSLANQKSKTVLGPVFGPIVSAKLTDKLSVSDVFLVGLFRAEVSGSQDDGSGGFLAVKETFDVTRFDNDLTLNYSLNSYVKVFGGIKYLGYTYSMKDELTYSGGTSSVSVDGKNNGFGPGAGIAFSYPLMDNLYALANVSAMYLRASFSFSGGGTNAFDANAYGGNGSVSLAYYFPEYGLTAATGVRYQQIKYNTIGASAPPSMSDKFYGIVFSIVWTF